MKLYRGLCACYIIFVATVLGADNINGVEVYAPRLFWPNHPNQKVPIPRQLIDDGVVDKLRINENPYVSKGEEFFEALQQDEASVAYTAAFCLSMWRRTLYDLNSVEYNPIYTGRWNGRKNLERVNTIQ